jgi:leucyl aminopeptidase
MPPLQPRNGAPRLQLRPGVPPTATLNRYDAVILLLPLKARPATALPAATLWQALHRRSAPKHAAVRVATLDNTRQTAAVLGYCREDADAFEVLRVSGVMAQKALQEQPRPRRIAIIAQSRQSSGARAPWPEAQYAALAAHAFRMPSAKGDAVEGPPLSIDLYGASKIDVRRAMITAESSNLVRHLTALPPNVLDATGYRKLLGTLARRHGLKLRWYGEAALEKLGAGAFLAVCRGNARRDAGIAHLSYRPARRARRDPDVALVGKGILFDTGGTNLKTHRSMLDMHTDMSGSAVALATLVGLARLKAPMAVDAWLAISENSIGPAAYRPQEVVRALNGTTIQVIHSDAEGRMVLADTLAMAARSRPRLMLDFATLTGACVYALTERMSGLLSNHDGLAEAAMAAGTQSGERVWRFPMPEDYDTDIDSQVADIAQCSLEGKGDHILATRFLQRFVPEGLPWAHVDLASSTRRGGLAHVPTEITGFGARFALALLLDGKLPA